MPVGCHHPDYQINIELLGTPLSDPKIRPSFSKSLNHLKFSISSRRQFRHCFHPRASVPFCLRSARNADTITSHRRACKPLRGWAAVDVERTGDLRAPVPLLTAETSPAARAAPCSL